MREMQMMEKMAEYMANNSSKTDFKCMGALLAGIACRSNETIKVHRLARDGYASQEEFTKAIMADQSAILGSQKNFAFVSAGQSDWLDILRPLAWTFEGFQKRNSSGEDSIGPVTRWFRTNTFYRKPLVAGKIQSKGDELCAWLPPLQAQAAKGIVFLLGPYSFARLVEDTYYNNPADLALDYSQAIASNIRALEKFGYGAVLLLEPSVGYDISRNNFSQLDWYCGALAKIKNERITLGVHFPLADAKYALPFAEGSAADFIGIDGTCTDFGDIKTKKDILLGIVDGARTTVETKEYVAKRAALFLESAEFSGNYYVGFNDRASDIPFAIAMEKIKALAEFKQV